jgi:hypothetical protein
MTGQEWMQGKNAGSVVCESTRATEDDAGKDAGSDAYERT